MDYFHKTIKLKNLRNLSRKYNVSLTIRHCSPHFPREGITRFDNRYGCLFLQRDAKTVHDAVFSAL